MWKSLRFMGCFHLPCVAVFPYIPGLRKRVVALWRLRCRVGFRRLSLQFVECLLGDSKFVHNKSSLHNLLRGRFYLPTTSAIFLAHKVPECFLTDNGVYTPCKSPRFQRKEAVLTSADSI
jgi:hypothetical protein